MRLSPLTFFDERKTDISMLVLHSVAFNPEEAIKTFIEHGVSSHYIIAEDGEIWQLVDESKRAWHAGKSKWRGWEDINSRSIGIEFCSKSLGQSSFSEAQQKSAIELLSSLIKKYDIKPENIVGHSDIAPERKPDPGKAFFWKALAENNIGWWFEVDDAAKVKENRADMLLAGIGYDISDISAAACAFCRRFLPSKVASESDINKLIVNPVPENFIFAGDEEFLATLKAVYYKYLKESKTPCNM